ncbi:hypothetical protein CHS0354_000810 [Potamilus streckersoni]|uniref:Peptidase S49 domain-containing protein n=1 Tax=Potamilus streckersoni TaxID=2493646 RepID=A0AAE0T7L2_9BIVA|nr:hypothetical protein CHS0354_000810 [Potamilus streckersoni]
MGGAFTAVSDNYSALYYNPAGLGRMPKSELSASFNYLSPTISTEYLNQKTSAQTSAFSLGNITGAFVIPNKSFNIILAIGYNERKNFAGGNRVTAQSSTETIGRSFVNEYTPSFDENGKLSIQDYGAMAWEVYLQDYDKASGRYTNSVLASTGQVTIKSNLAESGSVGQIVIGLGMEVSKNIFLGVSGSYIFGTYHYKRLHTETANTSAYSNFRELILDESVAINFNGFFFQIGGLIKINAFTVGTTIDFPYYLNITDRSSASLGVVFLNKPDPNAKGVNPGSSLSELKLDYKFLAPIAFRVGISYLIDNEMLLSLDFGYRAYTQGNFSAEDKSLDDNLSKLNSSVKEELNTFGFETALGAEYRFLTIPFIVRVGGNYTAPVYTRNLSGPVTFENGILGFSAGAEYVFGKSISTSLAFRYTYNRNETTLFKRSSIVSENISSYALIASLLSPSKKYWSLVLSIVVVIFVLAIFSIFKQKNASKIGEQSILLLKATSTLPEFHAVSPSPFGSSKESPTFQRLIRQLAEAKIDNRIELVVIEIELETLPAKTFELHDAIKDYRTSGKPIWAFLRYATDLDYMVASACDYVIFEPFGVLEINGLKSQKLYFSKTLKTLGIQMETVRVGKYKSAIEPFTRTSQSKEDEEQDLEMLTSLFNSFTDNIVKNRNIAKDNLINIIENEGLISDDIAKSRGLVDTSLYFNDVKAFISKKFGFSKFEQNEHFIDATEYKDKYSLSSPNQIAVINVMGTISGGSSNENQAGDVSITKSIELASNDPNIKAIIMRVDSPGGSVVSSDKIHHAILQAKKSKPVIVSMSDLAASGGYWVSTAASKIVTHPMSITGSIGIFSLKPNLTEARKKLEIYESTLKKGELADDFSLFKEYSPKAMQAMEKILKTEYDYFVSLVAKSRSKLISDIENISQGRVWLGAKAIEHGLADKLGGFFTAVETAKSLANISEQNVELINFPKQKSFFSRLTENEEETLYTFLLNQISNETTSSMLASYGLLSFSEELFQIKETISLIKNSRASLLHARLPFTLSIE